MLNVDKDLQGDTLTVSLDGRLDTTTSPDFEAELKSNLDGVKNLVFDFEKLEYISSAGLRVMLSAQKIMNKQGEMSIKNASDDVLEVFEITGFIDIINIQ
ncbi:MAG: STAS domain-containing protein [Eubacterium sp.]|nr:STAS domain-containing protein [Eubacterium sp.]MBR1773712.1 STAS domain-containing protein [Eubacterium sp.]